MLRSIDGNVHFIPNSKIDVVTNTTKAYSFCMLNIGVAYREDVDEVMSVIKDVAEAMRGVTPYSDWILEPVDVLGLDEFAESAMVIKARMKVQPVRQWKVKREFNRRLKKAFDVQGIEIPYPHRTVYLAQDRTRQTQTLQVGGQ